MSESPARMAAIDPTRFAAIDIGTQTSLLLIAEVRDGVAQVLEDHCVSTRLGEGSGHRRVLQEESMSRTLRTLGEFLERCRVLGVPGEHVRAASTAVLRRAINATEWLAVVKEQLGLGIEVLSGEDEARLGYAAVSERAGSSAVRIIDVGGGSTELVWSHGEGRCSAPIGAVVLSERYPYHADEALREERLAALWHDVRTELAVIPAQAAAEGQGPVWMLGGSASNLACLDQGLVHYDYRRAEGHVLSAGAAARHAARLFSIAPQDRESLGIEVDRARILPYGLFCLAGVMERLAEPPAWVTGCGLRHGLLAELCGLAPPREP